MITSSRSQIEHARRLNILRWIVQISLGINIFLLLIIVAAVPDITDPTILPVVVGQIGLIIISIIVLILIAQQKLEWATHIFFISMAVNLTNSGLTVPQGGSAPYILLFTIVGATLLLQSWWTFFYAILTILSYSIAFQFGKPPSDPRLIYFIFQLIVFSGNTGLIALLSFLSARGYERVVGTLVSQADELVVARTDLEQRVAERTLGLQTALDTLQRSDETIRQLSVPLLPLADGVLLLPLIGSFTPERAAQLTETLLETVYSRRPHTVLIDQSAVGMADGGTTQALARAITAVRLLGAETVLVGIRPETAQAMLEQGVVLTNVPVYRDVQSGLAYALGHEAGTTSLPPMESMDR